MIKRFLAHDFEFMNDITYQGGLVWFAYAAVTLTAMAISIIAISLPVSAIGGLFYQPIWDSDWGTLIGPLPVGVALAAYPFAYARADYRSMPTGHGRRVMQKIDRLDAQYRNQLPHDYVSVIKDMDARGEIYSYPAAKCSFEADLDALLKEQAAHERELSRPQRETVDALHAERRNELTEILRREAEIAKTVREELGW